MVSAPNMPEYLRSDGGGGGFGISGQTKVKVGGLSTLRSSDVAACHIVMRFIEIRRYPPINWTARTDPLYDAPPVSAELKAHWPWADEGVARKQPVVLAVHCVGGAFILCNWYTGVLTGSGGGVIAGRVSPGSNSNSPLWSCFRVHAITHASSALRLLLPEGGMPSAAFLAG